MYGYDNGPSLVINNSYIENLNNEAVVFNKTSIYATEDDEGDIINKKYIFIISDCDFYSAKYGL